MDLSDIPLPGDHHVFTCGPLDFMRHIRTELMQRGVPAHHIRYEVCWTSDLEMGWGYAEQVEIVMMTGGPAAAKRPATASSLQ